MKQRMLFVAENMNVNGANKSLLNLLSVIDTERYDVDLFLYAHTGPFLDLIPAKINLLPEDKYMFFFETDLKTAIKRGNVQVKMIRLKSAFCRKFFRKNVKLLKEALWKYFEGLKETYDLAIGYCEGSTHSFVLRKVNARVKVGWIHISVADIKSEACWQKQLCKQLDYSVVVSEDSKEALIKMGVDKEKVKVIYNVLSAQRIRELSLTKKNCFEVKRCINLLTIGRLVKEKGIDIIVETCRKLLQMDCDIKWWIIGDGGEKAKYLKLVKEYNLQDKIIFLGNVLNPYPYIKECDIYIQPSRSEGWGMAITEAKILGKPVIASDIPVFSEQITTEKNGIIVSLLPETISDGILRMVNSPELIEEICMNLRKESLGNEKEVEKLYELLL